jgi:uncharacterized glyoxalase superfamily protein PhnB
VATEIQPSVSPLLTVSHAAAAIDFYTKAFDGKQPGRVGCLDPTASSTTPPRRSTQRR